MADVSIDISNDVKEFTPAEALIAMGPDPSVIDEILLKAYASDPNISFIFNHEHVLVRYYGTFKQDNGDDDLSTEPESSELEYGLIKHDSGHNDLSIELKNNELKRGLIYIETYVEIDSTPAGILKDILYPVYRQSENSRLDYYKAPSENNMICYVYEDTAGVEIKSGSKKLRKFYIWYSSDVGFSLDMIGSTEFETFVGVKF